MDLRGPFSWHGWSSWPKITAKDPVHHVKCTSHYAEAWTGKSSGQHAHDQKQPQLLQKYKSLLLTENKQIPGSFCICMRFRDNQVLIGYQGAIQATKIWSLHCSCAKCPLRSTHAPFSQIAWQFEAPFWILYGCMDLGETRENKCEENNIDGWS